MAYDAIIRNLEIIGEAVKSIPESVLRNYPEIDWKGFAGLRDILIHRCFGVTDKIIWDIVENELPALEEKVMEMADNEGR